jgi:hypothetical protein
MATYFAQNLSDDLPLSRTDLGRLFQMAHSFGYARICRGEILGDGGGKASPSKNSGVRSEVGRMIQVICLCWSMGIRILD